MQPGRRSASSASTADTLALSAPLQRTVRGRGTSAATLPRQHQAQSPAPPAALPCRARAAQTPGRAAAWPPTWRGMRALQTMHDAARRQLLHGPDGAARLVAGLRSQATRAATKASTPLASARCSPRQLWVVAIAATHARVAVLPVVRTQLVSTPPPLRVGVAGNAALPRLPRQQRRRGTRLLRCAAISSTLMPQPRMCNRDAAPCTRNTVWHTCARAPVSGLPAPLDQAPPS